jgi:hypothetical protein
MKQSKNKNIKLKVLSYEDGKYRIKFPNLEVPIVVDESLYKKWIVNSKHNQFDN